MGLTNIIVTVERQAVVKQTEKVRQMKERFFDYQDGQSTERVVNEIERVLQSSQ